MNINITQENGYITLNNSGRIDFKAIVKTTLTNHLYLFDGEVYKQKEGGPIGDNVTQIAARIAMFLFSSGYKRQLTSLGLLKQTYLLKLYVDDLNQAGYCLPLGTWFKDGKIYLPGIGWRGRCRNGTRLSKEQMEEIARTAEEENARTHTVEDRERHSASIYREIANTIRPRSVRMKEDIPANHPSGMLPILDCQMAVVGGRIVHHYYAKPMASLEVVLKRSAMSMGSKLAILVQEGCRRVRNCSPWLPWTDKVVHINKLMAQVMWAGYSSRTRELIAHRILGKQDRNLENLELHNRPLYRSKQQNRAQDPETGKNTWFRKEGATATLMIPETKDSDLAKRLRIVVASIPGPRGTHVKVVEKPGPTIMRGISSTNPFKLEVCPKDDCPINEGGLNCLGKCSCENIIYRATCIKCVEEQVDNGVQEDQVIKHQYIGETSRTVRTRRIQHLNDYKKCIKYKQTHGQTVTDNLGENDKLSSFILDHKTNIQRRLTLIQRRI